MKKLLLLITIVLTYSCTDDEIKIDKDQLILGTWLYENTDITRHVRTRTLDFKIDGTYTNEIEYFGSTNTITNEGDWFFGDNNVIDLTDYGTCIYPVGAPPCTPPDVDFKIMQLTKDILFVEELVNGKSMVPSITKRYVNIKN